MSLLIFELFSSLYKINTFFVNVFNVVNEYYEQNNMSYVD